MFFNLTSTIIDHVSCDLRVYCNVYQVILAVAKLLSVTNLCIIMLQVLEQFSNDCRKTKPTQITYQLDYLSQSEIIVKTKVIA